MKAFRDPVDEWLKRTVGTDANPMITMLGELSDQHYDFARAFVLCGSPRKAAERINLPSNQNPTLLVHLPKVAACINILTAKREEALGQKTSAEIMERLTNTSIFEADDFGLSTAAVKEREEMLTSKGAVLKGLSDSALTENVLNTIDPSAVIMQLPKVKVPQASSFGPAWIIERCVTVAERCLQLEPVYDTKGRPIGKFQFNAPAALKALEMLGKTMAMFQNKIEISGELSTFKAEELDDRIKALVSTYPELAKIVEVEQVA